MTHRQLKPWYFVLEGINSFATALYYNYLFFFMQSHFGFRDLQNLSLSASSGLLYTGMAWYAGRFAQRHGYFNALQVGFVGMPVAMITACLFADHLWMQVAALLGWTVSICFTWPALEALASDHEPPGRLPRIVGLYNLVWAGGAALAYFSGGAIVDYLGARSIFVIPMLLHGLQLAILHRLRAVARGATDVPSTAALNHLDHPDRPSPERARLFLRLAWLANPFAYMAISTLIPVIPGLARRFELSTTSAGFFCSIWFFARMGAFIGLWMWTRWHYRFRWFLTGFVLMIASFATILLSSSLVTVLLAQIAFGICTGLIYYSSLFYSMDAGDTKGEHGGIHESAIGAGIFAGPAAGAAGLLLLPSLPQAGAWAVSGVLVLGLLTLLYLARKGSDLKF